MESHIAPQSIATAVVCCRSSHQDSSFGVAQASPKHLKSIPNITKTLTEHMVE